MSIEDHGGKSWSGLCEDEMSERYASKKTLMLSISVVQKCLANALSIVKAYATTGATANIIVSTGKEFLLTLKETAVTPTTASQIVVTYEVTSCAGT